jgi:signal transduction histidine kinase
VVESAMRLCDAYDAVILLKDGETLRMSAHFGPIPIDFIALPLNRDWVAGCSVIDSKVMHIPDLDATGSEFPLTRENAAREGFRALVAAPLLRRGTAIGTILIRRLEARPFSDKQIVLLQTFADQAVIAIENTRLFEEVQARTRELQELLEFQTASSEVLNVISRSPAQLQPVLNTIVETASRLCKADHAHVFRLQDGKYHLVAHNQTQHHIIEYLSKNPIGLDQLGSVTARAARACKTVHVPDAMQDPEYGHGPLTFSNDRTVLSVPWLREGIALGVVTVGRQTLRPFTGNEIELVESFADQVVIAIENTRLFEEVQARTRALQESLEYQTAMSDVLGVISSSPDKLQPVLDAIVNTAKRLCIADRAYFNVLVEGRYHSVAATEGIPKHIIDDVRAKPEVAGRGSHAARAVLEKRPIHIKDTRLDPEFTLYDVNEPGRARTLLGVPLLRRDEVIGVITLARIDPAPFTQRQIDLVATFANQAVIAINNVDLFEEVQARNRDLTALGEVGRAVSSTLELRTVLKTIVDRAIELSSTDGGSIFYFRNDRFELGETTGLDEEAVARFSRLDISAGQTGLGEAIASRSPLQIADITRRPSNPLRDAAIEAGLRAALIVPLLSGDGPLGALVLQRRTPGEFSAAVVTLMQSFADQSAIALENARLFEEIAHKSRELEIASQHKSQFVANMSHELRTPLAAILGYAELMQEGFYERLGQKSLDALTRIRSNGKHLLGLINTVLDIAKIESGQFTLNMTEYAIESVVETVRAATESLAQNKKLTLTTSVDKSLPVGLGDEQRLTQVLLNLVGNAIKFTDRGEVRVTAKAINGHFNVSVTDTGPGIPEHERARIFEQFHQVDSSLTNTKGGTGLGLAIAKQIVEMHGGRIWVESTVGKGSTFQMELPTRAEFRKRVP